MCSIISQANNFEEGNPVMSAYRSVNQSVINFIFNSITKDIEKSFYEIFLGLNSLIPRGNKRSHILK